MFSPNKSCSCSHECGPLTISSALFMLPLLQIIINPNYEVPETDYSNNIMKCRCRYDGHRVWMYSCHNGMSTQFFNPVLLCSTCTKHPCFRASLTHQSSQSANSDCLSLPGGSLSTESEQTFPGLLNNQVTHR